MVTFSGDKLLGGPQAGLIAGEAATIERIRANPLFRALRADKMIYAALEATLREYLFERWDRIPALAMIRARLEALRERAERLAAALEQSGARGRAGRVAAGRRLDTRPDVADVPGRDRAARPERGGRRTPLAGGRPAGAGARREGASTRRSAHGLSRAGGGAGAGSTGRVGRIVGRRTTATPLRRGSRARAFPYSFLATS